MTMRSAQHPWNSLRLSPSFSSVADTESLWYNVHHGRGARMEAFMSLSMMCSRLFVRDHSFCFFLALVVYLAIFQVNGYGQTNAAPTPPTYTITCQPEKHLVDANG